jgi:hypothetical protein
MNFKFYIRRQEVAAIIKGDGRSTYTFKYVCVVENYKNNKFWAFWYNEDGEIETESELPDNYELENYVEMDQNLVAFQMLMGLELPKCLK